MKKVLAVVAIVALAFSVAPAFAQVPEPIVTEGDDLQTYGASTVSKAARGVGNVAFGWTQPFQDLRNNDGENPAVVFVEGLGTAVIRTAAGIAQILTSIVPNVGWEGDAAMSLN